MKTQSEIQDFLDVHQGGKVTSITELFGGRNSQAFSYAHEGKRCVIRINVSKRGFMKDRFATENFGSNVLPIPKVREIGLLEEGLHFCISDFVEGESARTQYKNNDFTSFSLQFEMLEKISVIPVPDIFMGYGEWDEQEAMHYESFSGFIRSAYRTDTVFDWPALRKKGLYDDEFITYLTNKIEDLLPLVLDERTLVHGDFGNDNFFIREGACSGVIDWDRSLVGNHFLDVGRIVLFCPNRFESSRAALDFYKDKEYENYREKILFGVYYTMLNNYAGAVRADMEDSCKSSRRRIEEIESVFNKS